MWSSLDAPHLVPSPVRSPVSRVRTKHRETPGRQGGCRGFKSLSRVGRIRENGHLESHLQVAVQVSVPVCRSPGPWGQEQGQERVSLAHGLVADDGHLAVPGCGHQGDDPAALKKAENTLAGATNDGLDLLLGGRRRGVVRIPAIVNAPFGPS